MTARGGRIVVTVVVASLLFVALVLVWTAPADIAWRFFRGRLEGWQVEGLSGSLWQGSAERAFIYGVPLGRVQWTVSRAAFFTGISRGHIEVAGRGIDAGLDFERHGNEAQLSGIRLSMPARWLAGGLALPGLTPRGLVVAKLPEMRLVDGYLRSASGSLEWTDAGVQGVAEGSVGDIVAEFERTDPGSSTVVLRVADRGARVGVAGSVRFDGPAFELDVVLSPRGANLQIFEVLRLIGQRLPNGDTRLTVRGRIEPMF